MSETLLVVGNGRHSRAVRALAFQCGWATVQRLAYEKFEPGAPDALAVVVGGVILVFSLEALS